MLSLPDKSEFYPLKKKNAICLGQGKTNLTFFDTRPVVPQSSFLPLTLSDKHSRVTPKSTSLSLCK
jgi:hypothetical protein